MKKDKKEKLSAVLSGVAGEYSVAAELSKLGFLASITLRNTKGVDILCSNAEATKSVGIQVKTRRGSGRDWMLNEKSEDYYAANLFYVFVNLHNNERPAEFFIVPSKVVAKKAKIGHADWLKKPRRDGKPHKDNPMRKFNDMEEKYLNRWDLLGLKKII